MSTESLCILLSEYNKWQGAYEEKDWPTETCNLAGFRQLASFNPSGSLLPGPLLLLALSLEPKMGTVCLLSGSSRVVKRNILFNVVFGIESGFINQFQKESFRCAVFCCVV
jgi:hypothetical protein